MTGLYLFHLRAYMVHSVWTPMSPHAFILHVILVVVASREKAGRVTCVFLIALAVQIQPFFSSKKKKKKKTPPKNTSHE